MTFESDSQVERRVGQEPDAVVASSACSLRAECRAGSRSGGFGEAAEEGIEALDGPLHDAPSGEGETRLIQMMSSSGRQHGALRKGWSPT